MICITGTKTKPGYRVTYRILMYYYTIYHYIMPARTCACYTQVGAGSTHAGFIEKVYLIEDRARVQLVIDSAMVRYARRLGSSSLIPRLYSNFSYSLEEIAPPLLSACLRCNAPNARKFNSTSSSFRILRGVESPRGFASLYSQQFGGNRLAIDLKINHGPK